MKKLLLFVCCCFFAAQVSYGQLPLNDDFEGSTLATLNPATYNVSSDVWAIVSTVGGTLTAPQNGNSFWGIQDLNNPNGGGGFEHTLTYDELCIAGYTNVQVSFYYFTDGFESSDDLRYTIIIDGVATTTDLLDDTDTWTQVMVNVPDGSINLQLILSGEQDGGSDYGGFDNVSITGTPPVVSADQLQVVPTISSEVYTCSGNFDIRVCGTDGTTIDGTFSTDITLADNGSSASYTLVSTATQTPDCGCVTYTITPTGAGTLDFTFSSTGVTAIQTSSTSIVCGDPSGVVINEIIPDTGWGDGSGEWVELYNPDAAPVDISGFILSDGQVAITMPAGSIIQGNDYFVIGSSILHTCTDCDLPNFPLDVDYATCGCIDGGSTLVLGVTGNGGEPVVLFDAAAIIVNAVYWDDNSGAINDGRTFPETLTTTAGVTISVPNPLTDPSYEDIGVFSPTGCSSSFSRVPDGSGTWNNAGTGSGGGGGDDTPTPGASNSDVGYTVNLINSSIAPTTTTIDATTPLGDPDIITVEFQTGETPTFELEMIIHNWQGIVQDAIATDTYFGVTGTAWTSSNAIVTGSNGAPTYQPDASGNTTLVSPTTLSPTVNTTYVFQVKENHTSTGAECYREVTFNVEFVSVCNAAVGNFPNN